MVGIYQYDSQSTKKGKTKKKSMVDDEKLLDI